MTILRLQFAGQIKKAEHRDAGGKKLVEVSLCKKNKQREGQPESFTWIRVTLWEPADFQAPKLIKGSFIAGSGEMMSRTYDGKDGKATSIEVSCRSFDVEVSDGAPQTNAAPATRPTRPAAADAGASGGDDSPPFMPRGEWE